MRPSVASPTGTEIGCARVHDVDAAREAVGRVHRDRADTVVPEVLLHLGNELHRIPPVTARDVDLERVVDRRQVGMEDDVDDDAPDLDDLADISLLFGHARSWLGFAGTLTNPKFWLRSSLTLRPPSAQQPGEPLTAARPDERASLLAPPRGE